MIDNVFANLAWVIFSVVFIFYVFYFALLFYYQKKSRIRAVDQKYSFPTVSLIVPVYNEEKIINKKIQNIKELDYPKQKIEAIFVDGKSTDNTSKIILENKNRLKKSIKLITQPKREGYTKAVIQGILVAKGEIIVLTDTGSYYYPDTLKQLVKHFSDPKIGATTGKEIISNSKKQIGSKLEGSYRFFYDFMRQAESEMDSTPDSKGEILAIRKKICEKMIPKLSLSPNASFDSCVPYQAKLMGYRTIYDEKAKYREHAPASISDRWKQQIRRATLLIGALLLYRELILNKKVGKFGSLILPMHFIMNCVIPALFIMGVFSLVISTFLQPFAVLVFWIIFLLLLTISTKTRSFLLSFVQSQFALFGALFQLARRKNTLFIKTIPSTRTV